MGSLVIIFIALGVIALIILFNEGMGSFDKSKEGRISSLNRNNGYSNVTQFNSEDSDYYKFEFGLIPDGYFYHEMVGMYYHGVTTKDFGVFYGKAVAEINNPKDKHAIGVYRKSDNKLVGYLPKEERGISNESLHSSMLYYGGSVNAIFRIQGSASRSYGSVYIEEVHKVFRKENEKSPYRVRKIEEFTFRPISGCIGRQKCYIKTNQRKDSCDYTVIRRDIYDYSVNIYNEAGELIGKTDNDQLQLFDYVEEKENKVLSWCIIDHEAQKGILYVPINFTENTVVKKLNNFLNNGK